MTRRRCRLHLSDDHEIKKRLFILILTAESVLQLVDLDALGGDEDNRGEEYDELHLVL